MGNRSKKKSSCMGGVPFVGGVVSWLVSFSCVSMSLSVPSEQCVISIREQRRPDRSCGEVSLIATKKRRKTEQKVACCTLCWWYLCLALCPYLHQWIASSEIVRSLQPAVKVYLFFCS